MISGDKILSVVSALYENAGNGTHGAWLAVYKEMAAIFSSGPGTLSLYDTRNDRFNIVAGTVEPRHIKLYNDYYHGISPFRSSLAKLHTGETFVRTEHCADKLFEATEIYQDFYRKLDIYEFEYRVLCEVPGLAGAVSFSRSRSQGRFTADERKAMSLLVPHLQRAFNLHMTLSSVRHENQQMSETLSRIPQSVIVINKAGNIVFLNAAAETILTKRDGLVVDRSGVLSASLAQDTRKLRSVLASIFDPTLERDAFNGGVLQLTRPSELRPLQVVITPFSERDFMGHASETLALMFVYDRDQVIETVEDTLSHMYGLTPAEARLLGIIAQGRSLKEAGEILEITSNTVRTHLKRIFSKTDTNRQSELITLILSSPANLKEPTNQKT